MGRDLFRPEVIANPYSCFGHLRDTEPAWGATLARIGGREVVRGLAERFERFELGRIPPEDSPASSSGR